MNKRGAIEIILLVFVAIIGVALIYEANANSLTGAQTAPRLRTVPRSGISECDNINRMTINLHQELEFELDRYQKISLDLQLLMKLKLKLLQISNTKLKSAVLTCNDWYALVPDLRGQLTCPEIDQLSEDEEADMRLEGKTCSADEPRCEDRFAYSKCDGDKAGGDLSLSCNCEKIKGQELCVPEDRKLWIFQKNVWTLKKLLIKIRLKLKLKMEAYSELHVRVKKHLDVVITLDGQLKDCFRRRCVTDCPQTAAPSGTIPRVRDAISVPGIRDQIALPQTTVDCETVCAKKGMSTQKAPSSGILAELQQYRCVSGASIKMKRATIGSCTCYSKPSISINKKKPICKNTPCGDVQCDGQAKCPCPDKPNCTLTVKCTWGGWEEIKAYQYAPIIGAKG